jgi:two-component system KDP operon response regulator KdpE
MKLSRILVVEDDPAMLKFLRANLKARGYDITTAQDGAEALELVEMNLPDLLLLDINLPKIDGFEVCRQLRQWLHIPIIVVSARGDERDKVTCLDLGADDYITKPFGIDELLARIRAALRRSEKSAVIPALPLFTSGNFVFNFMESRVIVAGKEVSLTPTEYNTLLELVTNAGKVITHEMLLSKVWGPEYRDSREYLHVVINRLRKKIEPDPLHPACILTIPGVGYRFHNA